jgi:hypothetical protein
MSAKIQCKCESKHPGDAASFQDRRYGSGVRIATPTAKGDDKSRDVRCTVCGSVQRISKSKLD